MELQFLGTSSGTPTKTRNVSALAIRATGSRQWSLVDCGEGTQHRILQTRLSLRSLHAIFITHTHGDHC
ncbi:MAG TPA: MBL fold metallo-hydrolase, partial [Noviherbaspirillum sp.]|nr:MBL fold metallo-hydrolase [Noviherbaspirillum sp.]